MLLRAADYHLLPRVMQSLYFLSIGICKSSQTEHFKNSHQEQSIYTIFVYINTENRKSQTDPSLVMIVNNMV